MAGRIQINYKSGQSVEIECEAFVEVGRIEAFELRLEGRASAAAAARSRTHRIGVGSRPNVTCTTEWARADRG